MKVGTNTALFIGENGKVIRVRTPFYVLFKNEQGIQIKVLVRRIVFEDETIVLYEVDERVRPYFAYDLIGEEFVRYEITDYI